MRLPKAVRFPETQHELLVRRDGKRIILEPADEWTADFVALGSWQEDIEHPKKRPISKKKDRFA